MAMPGGCLSTGRSNFSCFQPRVLNNYSKSVASQRRRIIAQLCALQKKLWHKCTAVTPDAAVHNFLWEAINQIIAGRLEKIISSVKSAGKTAGKFIKDNAKYAVMIGATALYGLSGETAKGGTLVISNMGSNQSGTDMITQHILGATENYDNGKDARWFNSSNKLQIYSVNNNCLPDTNTLSTDARDQNSTTVFNDELYNNGFSGVTNNFLRFTMIDSNDFEWKNMFLGDTNNSESLVGDIKSIIYNSGKIKFGHPYGDFQLGTLQGSQTGVYDRRKVMFFNHADLNRDKKVDLKDFAILGNVWKDSNEIDPDPNRFGSYVGKDVNDLGAYADIDRNGIVDLEDLGIYCSEYLWDADDPNTW